ncbi:MAG: HD domain-containing protein [Oculatellaceae cyanobacterium Prado106]|jgi:putative hydrolase of HD superfamily|nr:HD domain-containing protein [Oculatellaceae cyanobacterium Prado106]
MRALFIPNPTLMGHPDRLSQQIQFIIEIDRLKQILRQTYITDRSRPENTAEHSWHIAVMATVLMEYAPPGANLLHAVKMLLIHDLVEIDAGDTFAFDVSAHANKAEREEQAAERLFGLLPADQREELRSLWDEFEARQTPTSRFANALDRIQPLFLNQQNQGGTWKKYGVTLDRVLERMQPVKDGTPLLWPMVEDAIATCIAAGYLSP